MAFTTARDICRGALEDLGLYAPGDDMDAADSASALERLNDLFDQAQAERLNIFRVTRTTFAITANDAVYTIGATGDITAVPRPMFVNQINFQDTSFDPDLELPMYPLTDAGYAAITLKAQTSPYPQNYYYNPTFPNGTITLWPVPTSTTLQLVIYAPQAEGQLSSLNTAFSMPPGYSRYMRKWLAIDCSTTFEKSPSPELREAYEDARNVVKRSNVPMMDLTIGQDSLIQSGRGLYNIYSDQGG